MEKEKKKNCRPLAAERSAAAIFVLFSTRAMYNFLHVN